MTVKYKLDNSHILHVTIHNYYVFAVFSIYFVKIEEVCIVCAEVLREILTFVQYCLNNL